MGEVRPSEKNLGRCQQETGATGGHLGDVSEFGLRVHVSVWPQKHCVCQVMAPERWTCGPGGTRDSQVLH